MIDLKAFRKANNLRQIEIAQYLEVSREFLSLVENGKSKLPDGKLQKLLSNTEGWDTSMLSSHYDLNSGVIIHGNNENSPIDNRHYYSESPDVLKAQIDMLDERIKEKDAQIKEKDAQIKDLLDILKKK